MLQCYTQSLGVRAYKMNSSIEIVSHKLFQKIFSPKRANNYSSKHIKKKIYVDKHFKGLHLHSVEENEAFV